MTQDEVVNIVFRFIVTKKMPKTCSNCGRVYGSLKEYVENTEHVGKPISYDAELGIWHPLKQLGTLAMANCRCGSTLSVDSQGMSLIIMWKLLAWLRKECKRRNVSPSDLLAEIRLGVEQKL